MNRLALHLVFVATLLPGVLCAQVPRLINYQGRVAVGGVNFDGTGQFKFALVDATGATTLWSNNGTSAAGSEPTQAVSLPVGKGLYSVLLGDATLANMTALPASVFTHADVRLRVWFNDGVNGSQLLTPDQRLAPASYLADGTVTNATIASGAIDGTRLAAASLNANHLSAPAAPAAGQVLSYDGAGFAWVPAAGGGGDSVFSLNGTDAYYLVGNVGLGTTTPANKLTVRTASNAYGMEHTDGTVRLSTFVGGSTGGGWLGTASNHKLSFFANDSAALMTIDTNGNVGIGTNSPTAKLDVFGDQMVWGKINFGNGLRQLIDIFGTGYGIGVQANNLYLRSGGGFAWHLGGVHNDNQYNAGGGTPLMTLDALGLSFGARPGQHLRLWSDNATRYFGIGIQAETIYFRSGDGAVDGFAWYKGGFHHDGHRNPGGGQSLMTLDGETGLFVSGKASVSTLTIRGGADLAEPFAMPEEIAEGSVVVIDDAHAGRLKLSTEAYDMRVAGIVSGANGINPGIALHQEGALEGGQNVALSGRVYVRADASSGAIKPGDMLTTSGTPGHAMKVGDRTRAQGAILGKAMSALEDGQGLVLVLVTLQ